MKKFKFLTKSKVSQLPKTAGVYVFKKDSRFLYIGKARNIQERVKNHFQQPSFKDSFVLDSVKHIGFIETDSEIDALILEAKLIKKYQPKYNTAWRDDKNYFYVVATKEAFPQIFITHRPRADRGFASIIGPFVDGTALKETLKILRKVFPYRSCNPPGGGLPKHPCLWYQLRRCPAPCLFQSNLAKQIDGGEASVKKECQKNAKNLMMMLAKGKTSVLKELKKEMNDLSGNQQFERASRVRDQISALEKIMSHSPVFESEQKIPRTDMRYYKRIEGYDIANIQGKEATGAMVVFTDGKPDKSQYRQFKIKGRQEPNDIAMLKEVLERRLAHQEWPYPDLILIDGGQAQFNAAQKVCSRFRLNQINIMSLAKRNNELYAEGMKKPVLLKTLSRETFNLILQLRDEAHRFAQRYHHHLRKKFLLK